ncbi:MAG: AraC family transcriptional regulator [Lapillicoccus sp.]
MTATDERATETLVAFVDVLADTLDDHDVSSADLAARLHLSRFHADRLIRGAAGEPPGALCRRVLLERAAYRLVTTRVSVLDVAIEAGYGSNEAFTRAFSRAYGLAPREFRARPGQIRLDAPNAVHFHPPGGLRVPGPRGTTKVTTMDLLMRVVEHHVWLTGQMVEHAAALTSAQLDEPIELSVDDDPQTLRSLLSRLVGQMDMWNCALAARPYDWAVENDESVPHLRSRLARVGPAYLSNVREVVDEGRLDDTFVDALCEPAEVFTYAGMVAHVLTFAAHRRTLVALALDHHGVTDLGWGDPMRWVAEPA